MSIESGTRLGPYQVLSKLGEGGMGQVYSARDTRLDRTVAIKVLTALSQADPELRARFEREAKLLASFDHPNICALHDVGREGDVDYIVMPLVSGETLSARLAKSPMPLPKVVEVATQIADALDRAHGHGIIHRDLKPGNVMLTKSGARLLDFGLARLDEPVSAEPLADMATRSVLTRVGAIMGTVPYMAPEQLNGKQVDARSDIWAFGCVLYQMIAGREPFRGESDAALIAAILASEPEPLSKIQPGTPAVLQEIVAGALVKDPELRWQSMRDVKRMLAVAARPGTGAVAQSPASSGQRKWMLPLVGTVALISVAGLAWVAWQPPASAQMVRFDVNAVGIGTVPHFSDVRPYFAVSPDGRRIVFQSTVEGRTDLWVKDLQGASPERIPDTRGAVSPFWSPDGQSIAFYAGTQIWRKALSGGPAQPICPANSQGINGTWNAGGVVLFSEWGTRRIMQVSENGGIPTEVRNGINNPQAWAHFLPDGRHYLFVDYDLLTSARRLLVGVLGSDETVVIPGVHSKAEYANGHLIFWREGGLVAQPFNPETYQLSGQPVPVADEVHAFSVTGFAAFSTSASLLVHQSGTTADRLVWVNRQGVEQSAVGPLKDYDDVQLSLDNSAVAFAARDPKLGGNDLFVHEFARDVTRQLTFDPGTENRPVWSPDGKTIVYAADRKGPPNIHARNSDGTGSEREIVAPAMGPLSPGDFTPDGRSLVFLQPSPATNYDVYIAPLDRSSPPVVLVQTRARESSARVSPDGRWLAYVSNESSRPEVYVQSLAGGHGKRQISRDRGDMVRWRNDNKELYFVTGPGADQVMAVAVTATADALEPAPARLLFVARARIAAYDVRRDGEQFLLISPDPVAMRGTMSAALNWARLLKK